MKPDEARELFDRLCAYYDRSPREASREAWLTELRTLDYTLGSQAVRSLVVTCKFWPSVAELYEQVTIVREQAAREHREQERREADATYDTLPRIALRDIPAALAAEGKADDATAVQSFLERWTVAAVEGLTDEGPGVCDDCPFGAIAQRTYQVGEYRLCAKHAEPRLRARARLMNEANGEAA